MENFDKKCIFFGARSPSQLLYIDAEGAFRNIFGVGRTKMDFLKSTKGGPFGSAGIKPLRGEASPLPLKSPRM